jgi:hypothetical protein
MLPDSESSFLAPEDFAILPWGWTQCEPNILAEIRRCGFNLAGFVRSGDLDLVRDAGLKAIVSDESIHVTDIMAQLDDARLNQQVTRLVGRVKDHPSLFGYYLRDEPGAAVYPGLARWVKVLRAADASAQPYINLFPNYASTEQMEAISYQDYIDSFLAIVSPPFISYDHYALMEGGTLRKGYFENLEIVRAAALRQGVPFWNIVLSNAHFHYAEPSPAGLRFQAYTTLAYGARGISYFTYFTPDTGNYRLAPINPFGEKTPTWWMLKEVNLQIHALGPTYLRLKSSNVVHTADVPPGCSGIAQSRFIADISDGSFVIGEFESPDDKPYVMVVNKDLHHSTAFAIHFKEKGQLYRTSPYTGAALPVGGEDNWLAPGQGVLLSLGFQ